MKNKPFLVILSLIATTLFSYFYFSYRLVQVPPGLTIDEASIGYNAVLIGKTFRDETGRFMPIFPLTINKSDWKQPSSVYSATAVFKLFGASIYNLRLISVFTALISLLLVIYLNYLLLGVWGSVFSAILFVTAPIVVMHSHLAQENIMPLPFVLGWLITILLYKKKLSLKYLVLSGFLLGMGIYSYKGMRAIVPSLALVTVAYLLLSRKISTVISFSLGLAPFVLIMPWINSHYSGALFDNQGLGWRGFYNFLYPYISNFDISALFLKGDATPWHSTGMHGVFLISTLPIFITGLVAAYSKKDNDGYWRFLLWGFLLSPLIFGQVAVVYRFSRLLVFVPFFISFSALGLKTILETKPNLLLKAFMALVFMFNFFDFINYYWFTYPIAKRDSYGQNTEIYYQKLAKLSAENGVEPYIFVDDFVPQGEDSRFYEVANFGKPINKWKPGQEVPARSILMTRLGQVDGFKQIDGDLNYKFFERN